MAITIDGTDGLTTDNGALKLDGTTLAVDDTNNRVGIGTSSPSATLETYGTSGDQLRISKSSGHGSIAFGNASTKYAGMESVSGGGLVVYTGNGSMSEAARLDSSGNLKFNSGFGSATTAYGVRAWANWNGTGTPSIRESGNVSSITDNGTGDFTFNFSTSMPDTEYAVSGCCDDIVGLLSTSGSVNNLSTSSVRIGIVDSRNATREDYDLNMVMVVR